MRYRRVLVSKETLLKWIGDGVHAAEPYEVFNGIPADARIVNVRFGWPAEIELLIESAEFSEVPEGDIIPEIRVVCHRIYQKPETKNQKLPQ